MIAKNEDIEELYGRDKAPKKKVVEEKKEAPLKKEERKGEPKKEEKVSKVEAREEKFERVKRAPTAPKGRRSMSREKGSLERRRTPDGGRELLTDLSNA